MVGLGEYYRGSFIRDSSGYICKFCQFRAYKYSWKKTKLKDGLMSHFTKCSLRFLKTELGFK